MDFGDNETPESKDTITTDKFDAEEAQRLDENFYAEIKGRNSVIDSIHELKFSCSKPKYLKDHVVYQVKGADN